MDATADDRTNTPTVITTSLQAMRPDLLTELQASAFRSLVAHLQERSDAVSNIDMMNTTGFCRNCLAKWMVLGARQLSKEDDKSSSNTPLSDDDRAQLKQFGYDDAAQLVYGTSYADWKSRHHKAATSEQLELYEATKHLHSTHDDELLKVSSAGATTDNTSSTTTTAAATTTKPPVLSNVCCEDVEEVAAETTAAGTAAATITVEGVQSEGLLPLTKQKSLLPTPHPFATPPPIPRAILIRTSPLRIAVLAASDRASRGEYPDGDLSIPAVERQVQLALGEFACLRPTLVTSLVPDEVDLIREHLVKWTNNNDDAVDLVLTTGGTGFAPRDVTPEATKSVVDTELAALMPMVLQATALNAKQPLATLSRATAGIKNQTVVANLPGNPKSIEEIMPVLFPQLLHALVDVRGW